MATAQGHLEPQEGQKRQEGPSLGPCREHEPGTPGFRLAASRLGEHPFCRRRLSWPSVVPLCRGPASWLPQDREGRPLCCPRSPGVTPAATPNTSGPRLADGLPEARMCGFRVWGSVGLVGAAATLCNSPPQSTQGARFRKAPRS